ncbi:hypothetical protein GCM10023318_24690 [Nocardia callitridis]|uniref:Uncharacterized protein n=1 Tax=Nocardia callitridis TaxID=648753 RepID=A0ABP9K693_9NOCA
MRRKSYGRCPHGGEAEEVARRVEEHAETLSARLEIRNDGTEAGEESLRLVQVFYGEVERDAPCGSGYGHGGGW